MKQRTLLAFGAVTLALALAGCSASSTSATSASSAKPKPTASHTAQPVLLSGAALVAAFTIPDSLSGDELGAAFIQKIQDWGQYGENDATQDAHVGSASKGDILESQSQAGGRTIASALIPSDRLTSPISTDFIKYMTARNVTIVDAWSKTYVRPGAENPFPNVNKEPFNLTLHFDKQTAISTNDATGQVSMDIYFTQHTDLKNLINPTQPGTINPNNEPPTQDGVQLVWRTTFVHDGGANRFISVIRNHT